MAEINFTGKDVLSKFRLDNKIAIVTGSGHGIGEAIALAFAGAGAHVVIAALHQESADETAKKVEALGMVALPLEVDVTQGDQVPMMVERAITKFGRIDILVNNVGGPLKRRMSPLDMPEDVWDAVIKLNLKSTFLCSKFVGRVMKNQNCGNIINIASGSGSRPYPDMIAYGVAKAGVINFTKTLSVCLAPYKIRVNCIAAGPTLTPGSASAGTVQQRAERAGISLGRIAYTEDIALTSVYLASEAADFVTGELIDVLGGPIFGKTLLERAKQSWE